MEPDELATSLEADEVAEQYDAINELKALDGEELARFAPQIIDLLEEDNAYLATSAVGLVDELASSVPHALVDFVDTLCTNLGAKDPRTAVTMAEALINVAQEEKIGLPLVPSDITHLYHNRFDDDAPWETIRHRQSLAIELLGYAPNPVNQSWLENIPDRDESNIQKSVEKALIKMRQYVFRALASDNLEIRRPAAEFLVESRPADEELEENVNTLLDAVDDEIVAESLTPLLIDLTGELVPTSRVLDELLGRALDCKERSTANPPEATIAAAVIENLGVEAARAAVGHLEEVSSENTSLATLIPDELDEKIRTLISALEYPVTDHVAGRAIVVLLVEDTQLADETMPVFIDMVTVPDINAPRELAVITEEILQEIDPLPSSVDFHTLEWLVHQLGILEQDKESTERQLQQIQDIAVAIAIRSPLLLKLTVETCIEAFEHTHSPALRKLILEITDDSPSQAASTTAYLQSKFTTVDTETRRLILEVLIRIARTTPNTVADWTSLIEQALADDEPIIRRFACRLLEELHAYPQPEALRTLKNDDPKHQVQEKARKTYYELRRDKPKVETAHRSELPRPTAPVRDGLQLVQWEGSGWNPINLCEFDEILIHKLLEKIDAGEDGGVVLPYYDPSMVVLFAVELLNRQPNEGLNIVIFGGGTSAHWGTKTDIKDCYGQIGLANAGPGANRCRMLPLDELFATARVTDSGEFDHDRSTSGENTLIVCRKFDRLQSIDSADVVLFGLGSRMTDDLLEQVGETKETAADVPMFLTQTLYTRQETGGYPEYRPRFDIISESTILGPDDLNQLPDPDGADILDNLAGADSLRDALLGKAQPDSEQSGYPPDSRFRERILTHSRTLRIEGVEASELTESMIRVNELAGEFNPEEYDRTSAQAQYALSFFERVPVPLEYHDTWIADKRAKGRFRLPRDSDRVLRDLREEFDSNDGPGYTTLKNKVMPHLEDIHTGLMNSNPMFERLKAYIDIARDSQHDLAIFCPKRTWSEMLQDALSDLENVSPDELDEWGVDIVDPISCRDMEPHSLMVIIGPQRTHLAGFYLHPKANLVSIMTYGGRWEDRIGGSAGWFVKQLNEGFGGRVFPYPETELVGTKSYTAGGDGGENTGLALARAFKRAAEESDSGRHREVERRKYRIELDDGPTLTRWTNQRVLKHSTEQIITEGEYRWTSPDLLKSGDTIFLFGDRRSELWRNHLEDTWEDEEYEAEENILRGIQLWHDHIRTLLESETDWSPGETVQPATVNKIYSELEEPLDRGKGAIADWLRGVASAEDPLDLVEDPALRIGPQQVEDIQKIGEVFDIAPLKENAEFIEYSMRAFRTLNRQEGSDFRAELAKKIAADDSNPVKEAAQRYSINTVEEVTDD